MKDLISVVVTCYNHQDYIEQCLRSIFAQTIEILSYWYWMMAPLTILLKS